MSPSDYHMLAIAEFEIIIKFGNRFGLSRHCRSRLDCGARGSVTAFRLRERAPAELEKANMTSDRDKHPKAFHTTADQQQAETRDERSSGETRAGNSRRSLVKAGLTAVPIVLTLRSRAAFGQGDATDGLSVGSPTPPGGQGAGLDGAEQPAEDNPFVDAWGHSWDYDEPEDDGDDW